ncbi:GNAT family N-acetyltransferase [Spongiactinospora sp. TRM90649]|uniref:GNAT family N-acetyltransferase n=1 Tax=Spongiactinospora sp. TRM90649 TaxID=3031114 RepID=UPI0023F70F8E|nr:GNAT family N-acetyltransferase [Spongiactinospora sp. TRM90649]MDF5754207.1 GNAT family N-acetyltransferase [Spongiactinospora sp. TRM90649]
MDEAVRARPARPDEAGALNALALRSKAHWGYDAAVLAAAADALRLTPDQVTAHRAVVAETDGRVLGFATLAGEPPDGELGLLFVEPGAIGRGVGRFLYCHVLGEAGRIGFTRVTVQADPHAEGFYLAMGAERTGIWQGMPMLTACPPPPEPSWVAAWTGGRPAVHVGNAGEFNAEFGGLRAGPDHYSCLAVFAGPHPAAVVLPEPVHDWWIPGLSDALGWGEVAVHGGVAPGGGVSAALAGRPALLAVLTSGGAAVLSWGRTTALARIVPTPAGVLGSVGRFESKRRAHALFGELAPGHPGIAVPAQRPAGSRRALLRELRAGVPLVLKREYGVGGSGVLVTGEDTWGIRALARRWGRAGVVVEEYVPGSGPYKDPTFDGVIGADGAVHPVGTGAMRVADTSYQGVTVGPGALPDALAETAERFGTAVGRALAADGYRGWYDVDFVADPAGTLAPTEINLRLTGPAAAFTIAARLDRLRGGRHLVRTLDRIPLGARLPSAALRDHVAATGRECADLGALLLVTCPTAAFEPAPYLGVALAARTAAALDAAEAAVRRAADALGTMFEGLSAAAVRARWPGARRRSPRRS